MTPHGRKSILTFNEVNERLFLVMAISEYEQLVTVLDRFTSVVLSGTVNEH